MLLHAMRTVGWCTAARRQTCMQMTEGLASIGAISELSFANKCGFMRSYDHKDSLV